MFTIDDTDLIRVKAGTALAEEARSVYTVTAQVSDGEDVHGSVEPAPAIDDTITVTVYVDDGVHRVPLLPAASHPHRDGMVRVINRSARAGEVSIAAFDAEGTEYGPLRLRIGANAAARFTSADLERGNAERGLAGAIGEGEGDWRLELTSALDLEVPAYARTRGGGTLASMHEVAPEDEAGHRVVFFNPASNVSRAIRTGPRQSRSARIRLRIPHRAFHAGEAQGPSPAGRGEDPGTSLIPGRREMVTASRGAAVEEDIPAAPGEALALRRDGEGGIIADVHMHVRERIRRHPAAMTCRASPEAP